MNWWPRFLPLSQAPSPRSVTCETASRASAEVTVADRQKLFATRLGDDDEGGEQAKPEESKLGVNVKDITPEIADRMKLPNSKGSLCRT